MSFAIARVSSPIHGIESLAIGVQGKRLLWRALQSLGQRVPEFAPGYQALEALAHFLSRCRFRFSRNRPPFHLEPADVRIAAQLPPAGDDRRVQRRHTELRMRRTRLQLTIERLELREHASHPDNRVDTIRGTAAVRGVAVRRDFDPREAFVADGDHEIGRLADDRAVGFPLLRDGFGTSHRFRIVLTRPVRLMNEFTSFQPVLSSNDWRRSS